ncbi:MAG TPA: menaquinone biosynthesis decarboxylase [Herpetosiphonaceae bacterium]|nr:menaquinone biosynthesis decarboxylase [Herpetosiphonaceae bacterium]
MSPSVPQSYRDLHEFVAYLERRKQLKRIKTPVSTDLEITEITDRVSKSRDKNYALLFENVQGFDIPVLINALGTEERMSWALGLNNLNELRDRMAGLVKPEVPEGMFDKLRKLGELSEVVRYRPKSVDAGPCQELVLTGDQVDLGKLPILKCWPQDGGRYITLPMVISRDPIKGIRNVGMYRLQVYDRNTVGMHWQIHKGGTEHQRESLRQGTRRLEVAVAIGSDPASIYAGSAPLPPGIDEIMFAGWLRHDRVEMVKCKTIDLEVPANAEIVLEGYVDPAEQRLEGPFGDHTGYYSLADQYPVMHVTAITRRRRPIYATTIVGHPPQEDYWLGKATERLFLPLMQLVIPEIVDVNMPAEGVFHNVVVVSIKKRFPGQARKVMYGIWGLMLLSLSKFVIVVDADVDVQDLGEVLFHVGSNVDPRRDTVVVEGPLDALDHSADHFAYGTKMGIDATRKDPVLDRFPREWPEDIKMAPEIVELVDRKWKQYGL